MNFHLLYLHVILHFHIINMKNHHEGMREKTIIQNLNYIHIDHDNVLRFRL